ncbi:MAG: succinate dehydrogenase, partial [Chlamydiae bacterium]|nr:succinate dehydrogenase [Chlamydiota bacterium]
MSTEIMATPRAYIKRRLHSILGLMIVLFLLEHLLTNSQAALLVGDNGMGFIRAVNFIKDLPYLPVLEITLIAVPILVHAVLGVKYALTAKNNCWPSKGDKPSLTEYPRNHAYTWQRITSWILLVGIILHVGYMRFYRYPLEAEVGDKTFYFTRLDLDPGLYTVADRL